MPNTSVKVPFSLKKGEYDLVNISLIGYDPNTNKSYEACKAEWDAMREQVLSESKKLRWYNVIRYIKVHLQVNYLCQKEGFGM